MKHIILILLLILFQTAGFSQTLASDSQNWNNTSIELNEQPELKIYPNPCVGQKLTIEINNEELSEIRISNIAGRLVILKQYPIPENKVELTLENTPNGIYLIQVKTSSNKLIAKKLIVKN